MNSDNRQFHTLPHNLIQRLAWLEQRITDLAQENAQLRQQLLTGDAAHYQALINSMQEGLILQDRQGVILEANPSAARILGLELSELKNRCLSDFPWQVIEENGQLISAAHFPVQRALREGKPNSDTVLGFIRADQPILWLSINAQPLFYPNAKRPYAAFASFSDITVRKQMQLSLQQSEERFELAVRGSNDGLWDFNFKTGEIYFSPRWKQMLGFTDNELPNQHQTWLERIHPEEYNKVLANREAYLKRAIPTYEFVYRLRHREGHYLPILTRGIAVWDGEGKPCRMIGTHTDLSVLQEAQQQLQQVRNDVLGREQQIQAMLDIAPDSIIVINDRGVIEGLNAATELLFGYSEKELMGKNVSLLMERTDAQHHNYYISRYIKTGKRQMDNQSRELSGRRCDGSRVPILLSIGEFEVNGKKKFAAFINNISRQKQTEYELQQARDVAEAANQSKSRFLATMSHEVRTPLNGILGMAELLSEMSLTEVQKQYIDNIRISGHSLLAIINDVLDFSRLESNRLTLHNEEFKLKQLLENISKIFRPLIEAKNLVFITRFDFESDYTVQGDPQRLQQILNNLLNNALKFTYQGHIEFNVYLQVIETDHLQVLFEVKDTGIGIDEKSQAHLFQPFSQVDDSPSRRFGGSGLGLAICKRLVAIFEGKIGVESALMQGSRFWFSIPMSGRMLMRQKKLDTVSTVEKKNLRFKSNISILVAEDNLINQIFIQESLQRLGATVTVAETGIEALKMVKINTYDVILMDCHMPEMDGFTTVVKIREWEQTEQRQLIPIIALTANAMSGERERCLNIGMNDYLTKPVPRELLLRTLQHWLPDCSLIEETSILTQPEETARKLGLNSGVNSAVKNLPTLDYSVLSQLREEIKINGVNRLIDLYLNELPNYFKQIETAITNNNAEALYLAAHKFKGASKNLGVTSVISRCEQLEQLARTGDLNAVPELFQLLLDSIDSVRETLLAEKNIV
jgi:PAS domain S-box-containing protein